MQNDMNIMHHRCIRQWARTAMMLLAALLTAMTAWGEAVTEEQAQEIALAFLKKHHAATAGTRRAPATPQLTTAGLVSGLYLFNVNDNGGFVIVSNDDRTIPILGYSDSGNIDIEKMPDNMRAWLQGYADEIAWLMSANRTRSQSTRSTTPRRDPIATKTAIAPLLTTTWSQGSPYNAAIYTKTGGELFCDRLRGHGHGTGDVLHGDQGRKCHNHDNCGNTSIPNIYIRAQYRCCSCQYRH